MPMSSYVSLSPGSTPAILVSASVPLLFPLSLALFARKWFLGRLNTSTASLVILIALLSAATGATQLASALHPDSVLLTLATALQSALESLFSGTTLFILRWLACQTSASPKIFVLILFLSALLIVCEFVSSVTPQSPVLLPSISAVTSQILSLTALALVIRAYSSAPESTEKGIPEQTHFSRNFPSPASLPTTGTWPFPTSLVAASRDQTMLAGRIRTISYRNTPNQANIVPPIIILVLVVSQIFALLCAAVNTVLVDVVHHAQAIPNPAKGALVAIYGLLITRSVCLLAWGVALIAAIYLLPHRHPVQGGTVALPALHSLSLSTRTPKSSFSRFICSDSASEYLSVPDPFASIPPPLPPPPLTPSGLDLDEIDVTHDNGTNVRAQYRFSPPRSKARRKGRSKARSASSKHQRTVDHTETTVIRPPSSSAYTGLRVKTSSGIIEDKDTNLGDEAVLSQLLLQSLDQSAPVAEEWVLSTRDIARNSSLTRMSVPREVHVPLISRWSSSTTLRSATVYSVCASTPASVISNVEQAVDPGASPVIVPMDSSRSPSADEHRRESAYVSI